MADIFDDIFGGLRYFRGSKKRKGKGNGTEKEGGKWKEILATRPHSNNKMPKSSKVPTPSIVRYNILLCHLLMEGLGWNARSGKLRALGLLLQLLLL